jgi:putative hydrolase of the HAD superfamily
MEIKAVILDFGGTLADGGLDWEPYHESIRNYLSSHGHPLEMRDLKRALRATLNELDRYRSTGKDKTFEEVYSEFLNRLGILHDDETLEWLHQNFKTHYKTSFYPCVEQLLPELAMKYKIALLSNTMSDQPKLLLKKAGLDKYFDLMICSRDLGLRKPNPEIFRYVLEQIDAEPSTTVHVGDSVESDMIGAQNVGITGIWIKTPDQQPWNNYAVNNICELPRMLEQIEKTC